MAGELSGRRVAILATDADITTSRSPHDLAAFCERILPEFTNSPQSA